MTNESSHLSNQEIEEIHSLYKSYQDSPNDEVLLERLMATIPSLLAEVRRTHRILDLFQEIVTDREKRLNWRRDK